MTISFNIFLTCNPLKVSLSTAAEPLSFDDDEGEDRQIFTSGGTAFIALNQTFALIAAALLGASLLGLLFLLGTNPGAGAGDQGGYGGGSSGYGSGYGGSGYGSHKTRREANWGKDHYFDKTRLRGQIHAAEIWLIISMADMCVVVCQMFCLYCIALHGLLKASAT